MTLVGVDTAGRSSFTTPPLFESAFGHTFATRVPGVNWATLAWFRSKAAQTFTADLLQAYTFLNAYNDGEEAYLAALRKAEALHGIGAPAGSVTVTTTATTVGTATGMRAMLLPMTTITMNTTTTMMLTVLTVLARIRLQPK